MKPASCFVPARSEYKEGPAPSSGSEAVQSSLLKFVYTHRCVEMGLNTDLNAGCAHSLGVIKT